MISTFYYCLLNNGAYQLQISKLSRFDNIIRRFFKKIAENYNSSLIVVCNQFFKENLFSTVHNLPVRHGIVINAK